MLPLDPHIFQLTSVVNLLIIFVLPFSAYTLHSDSKYSNKPQHTLELTSRHSGRRQCRFPRQNTRIHSFDPLPKIKSFAVILHPFPPPDGRLYSPHYVCSPWSCSIRIPPRCLPKNPVVYSTVSMTDNIEKINRSKKLTHPHVHDSAGISLVLSRG